MRTLAVAVALFALGACDAAAATSLKIVVWPNGTSGPQKTWTLRCAPAEGTLPMPGRACQRLTALSQPFAPVPKGVACADIYGGPQVARVTGTFRGTRVDAVFKRTNGCEIERWQRVGFLFPVRVGLGPA